MDELNILYHEIHSNNLEIMNLINKQYLLLSQYITANETDCHEKYLIKEMLQKIINSNDDEINNKLVKEIFLKILDSIPGYIGTDNGKKLLVSGKANIKFNKIHEMFNVPKDLPVVVAGPCAIESIECLDIVARSLMKNNVRFIRGGAYKPRTSPYDFQGLKEEALKILYQVSKRYDLISVTEVVDTRDVERVISYTDILQIGTRNMQNYELLKEVGKTNHPVILKRGMSATLNEFMLAAEYMAIQGNRNIILCERGIRTFETKTRNTLDISCIPIIKNETDLPIIVDLSHSLGRKDIVTPIAKSILAAGADGVMLEVHPNPDIALSDSKQQLNIDEFENFLRAINKSVLMLKLLR